MSFSVVSWQVWRNLKFKTSWKTQIHPLFRRKTENSRRQFSLRVQ